MEHVAPARVIKHHIANMQFVGSFDKHEIIRGNFGLHTSGENERCSESERHSDTLRVFDFDYGGKHHCIKNSTQHNSGNAIAHGFQYFFLFFRLRHGVTSHVFVDRSIISLRRDGTLTNIAFRLVKSYIKMN